jgi:hypothetical protein
VCEYDLASYNIIMKHNNCTIAFSGVARILGKGVLEDAHAKRACIF